MSFRQSSCFDMALKEIVVLLLFTSFVVCKCHQVVGETSLLSRDEDLELERQLKILNKPAMKTIQTDEGVIYDCVDINKQPAFDHPLLKNHTIKMRPNYMKKMAKKDSKVPFFLSLDCPKGSVPIRRTQKEDLIRAKSLSNTLRKRYIANVDPLDYPAKGFHYARLEVASKDVINQKIYGARADINIWNPRVHDFEYSNSQIWIQNGPLDQLNIIEVGWTINPTLYRDNLTRNFVYWTTDSYQKTGCFNLLCPGFVHVDPNHPVDGYFANISTLYGPQFGVTLQISRDDHSGGDWVLTIYDNIPIGYWPNELFTSLHDGASEVHFGGQVHTNIDEISPPMGSGHIPIDGPNYKVASYIRNVQLANTKVALTYGPPDGSNYKISEFKDSSCYGLNNQGNRHDESGYFFFHGGRGGRC